MKSIRRVALILTILLLSSVVLLSPHMTSASSTVTVITTVDTNLRAAPDPSAPVLTIVPSAIILTATARDISITWVQASYAGQTGWLYAPLLSHTVAFSNLPIVKVANVVTSNTVQTSDNGIVTATALYDMNVRGGPGTQYELLGDLAAGDTVVLDGQSYGWFRYAFKGITKGWLRGDLVAIEGNIADLPDVTYTPIP